MEDLKLGDESYKLFFNATGHKGEISEDLKALLNYFLNPERMPEDEKTELVRKIDGIVDFANQDNDWRRGYMTYAQAQMDAMNEGIAIGEARGALQMLAALVRDGVLSIQEASKRANISEQEFAALISVQ